nr:hypothetical protein CFP56_64156 [Quercus suber]
MVVEDHSSSQAAIPSSVQLLSTMMFAVCSCSARHVVCARRCPVLALLDIYCSFRPDPLSMSSLISAMSSHYRR